MLLHAQRAELDLRKKGGTAVIAFPLLFEGPLEKKKIPHPTGPFQRNKQHKTNTSTSSRVRDLK